MKDLHVNLIPEKNRLSGTGAWLTLIELSVTDALTLYLTPNPAPVTFASQTYMPFPVQIDSSKQDASGGLSVLSVHLGNVTRELSAYLEANDLNGRTVDVKRVHQQHLSDPTALVDHERYEITAVQIVGDEFAKFTMGHDRLLTHEVPGRRFYRTSCSWNYKDPETCAYVGALPTCSKRIDGSTGCRAHNNVQRYGGWPNMVANAN